MDYACDALWIGLPFRLDYALDFAWITMATDVSSLDLNSLRNCLTCKTRMSSLLHVVVMIVLWIRDVRNVKVGQRKL